MMLAVCRGRRAARDSSRRLLSSSSASSSEHIQEFYDRYVSSFVSGDMHAVSTQFYHAPVSISLCVDSQSVMRSFFPTAVDVEQALTFQMEGMVARGYGGRSDMKPITIVPMTDIAQLIQTEGVRFHVSGDVLEKIRASYVIERISDDDEEDREERWYITSVHAEIIPQAKVMVL